MNKWTDMGDLDEMRQGSLITCKHAWSFFSSSSLLYQLCPPFLSLTFFSLLLPSSMATGEKTSWLACPTSQGGKRGHGLYKANMKENKLAPAWCNLVPVCRPVLLDQLTSIDTQRVPECVGGPLRANVFFSEIIAHWLSDFTLGVSRLAHPFIHAFLFACLDKLSTLLTKPELHRADFGLSQTGLSSSSFRLWKQ